MGPFDQFHVVCNKVQLPLNGDGSLADEGKTSTHSELGRRSQGIPNQGNSQQAILTYCDEGKGLGH